MCILPNFATRDLEDLGRNRKKEPEKVAAETVELIVPEQPLEDSI
jgi:hypothetical protein